jgi:hypothetical protein
MQLDVNKITLGKLEELEAATGKPFTEVLKSPSQATRLRVMLLLGGMTWADTSAMTLVEASEALSSLSPSEQDGPPARSET